MSESKIENHEGSIDHDIVHDIDTINNPDDITNESKNNPPKSRGKTCKISCQKCGYYCSTMWEWKRHIVTNKHKNGGDQSWKDKDCLKCSECDYLAKTQNNIMVHYYNKHGTPETRKKFLPFYCDACDFGTMTQSLFSAHASSIKHSTLLKKAEQNHINLVKSI